MWDLIRSVEFWVAMSAAVLLKLRASPKITLFGSIFTIAIAVTAALVFTHPVVYWLSIDAETYAIGISALIALSAEHLARMFLETKLADLIAAWRGKQ